MESLFMHLGAMGESLWCYMFRAALCLAFPEGFDAWEIWMNILLVQEDLQYLLNISRNRYVNLSWEWSGSFKMTFGWYMCKWIRQISTKCPSNRKQIDQTCEGFLPNPGIWYPPMTLGCWSPTKAWKVEILLGNVFGGARRRQKGKESALRQG